MKKLLLLLLLGAAGTLGFSAYRGEPDGLFARVAGWTRPTLQRIRRQVSGWLQGSAAPRPAVVGLGDHIDMRRCSFRCGYRDRDFAATIQTYEPDAAGLRAVGEILGEAGLASNFKVLAGDVANAAAFTLEGERLIVYSNAWMQQLTESAQSKWAVYAVLAHEIAHHLNGDTMASRGDYDSRTAAQNHTQELSADFWAGFALARLGATREETTAAVRVYGGNESHSHPDRQRRIEAHTNGWLKGREGLAEPAPAPPRVSEALRTLQQVIGRHAEHHGPGHFAGGRPGVVQYKIRFDGVVLVVKGILYDVGSREVSIIDWRLDPRDGRPHGVTAERTGVVGGVDCHRVTIANAGSFAYSVAADERGERDPEVFRQALARYVELAGR